MKTKTRLEMAQGEAKVDPVFLIQRRRLYIANIHDLIIVDDEAYDRHECDDAQFDPANDIDEYDEKSELYDRESGIRPLTDQQIVRRGYGEFTWETKYVAYSREEGEAFSRLVSHDKTLVRVFCVSAVGVLATALNATEHYLQYLSDSRNQEAK